MTIRHLKIFIMVVECKTMSLAAEKLYLSQPTVSQAIRELEEHYGGLLFERLSKHLYITEAGEHLLLHARKVISQFDELEERMADDKKLQNLRVGASLTVGTCILPELIQKLKRLHPEIDILANIHNTKHIEEKLLGSELDIALVEGRVKSPELICNKVIEDELVMVCAGNHAFAGRKELTFGCLDKARFVMREQGSGTRELFEKELLEHKRKVHTAWEVVGTEAVKQAVLLDQCLSVISFRLVEEEIRSGRMYMFRAVENRWKRSFSLVYHKNKYVNERMQYFCDMAQNVALQEIITDIPYGYIS